MIRRILNLGSGRTYRADAMNVDMTADTSPDVVHNLNQRPWRSTIVAATSSRFSITSVVKPRSSP